MVRSKANEFKLTCKEFLVKQGIAALRPYGRQVGVAEPTAKTKLELIEDIISILAGEQAPTPRSPRGAPVKDDFVDPYIVEQMEKICNAYPFDSENSVQQVRDIQAQLREMKKHPRYLKVEDPDAPHYENRGQREIFKRQYVITQETSVLYPLSLTDSEENIHISEEMVQSYALREGDIVTCYAERRENALVATEVVTINGTLLEFFHRERFEEMSACYPHQKIRFYHQGPDNLSDKCLDWLLPIGKGQRGLLISPPKVGKSTLLLNMAKSIQKCNHDIKVLVLLVEQSPESIGQFRKEIDRENLIYTTYEDSPERQIFVAEFLLKRAKRLAECGTDVCVLVDSFNTLARAYNDTNDSLGGRTLEGGMESKTLQYMKRYFGTARCLENKGSVTMFGALSVETGDPADELLQTELAAVSNYRVYLQEKLAKRRIYPAIDFKNTQGNQNGALADCEEAVLHRFLQENYDSEEGAEKALSVISKCSIFKQFQEKIRQSD